MDGYTATVWWKIFRCLEVKIKDEVRVSHDQGTAGENEEEGKGDTNTSYGT